MSPGLFIRNFAQGIPVEAICIFRLYMVASLKKETASFHFTVHEHIWHSSSLGSVGTGLLYTYNYMSTSNTVITSIWLLLVSILKFVQIEHV